MIPALACTPFIKHIFNIYHPMVNIKIRCMTPPIHTFIIISSSSSSKNNNENKARCEVPLRFTPGWHSGDAGVCLWAVQGATELRVHSCGILRLAVEPWSSRRR